MLPYNRNLRLRARGLRKDMTKTEIFLWAQLKSRRYNIQFYRQKVIGNYIVDFYCHRPKLVIEIDGWSHEGKWEYDLKKNQYLKSLGLKILRFKDRDILEDLDNVLCQIWAVIEPYVSKQDLGKNPP